MSQLTFQDLEIARLARRRDPPTNKASAIALVRSGKLTEQQAMALAILRDRGEGTAWELAEGKPLIRFMLNRRLPELVRKGFARRGAPKICRITSTRQTTWHLVEGR